MTVMAGNWSWKGSGCAIRSVTTSGSIRRTGALGLSVQVAQRRPAWSWVPPGGEPPPRPRFEVLPRRWVVERTFAWLARFRRLARDYERLPSTLAGLHFLAVACLMLHQLFQFFSSP